MGLGEKRKVGWTPGGKNKKDRRALPSDVQWGSQPTVVGVSTTFTSDASGQAQVTTEIQSAPALHETADEPANIADEATEIVVPPAEIEEGGDDGEANDDEEVNDGLPGPEVVRDGKQSGQADRTKSRKPIWAWISERPDMLRELINLDGRHRARELSDLNMCRNRKCTDTRGKRRYYRCASGCMRCDWYCRTCLLEKHADQPLHRVEAWIDGHWQKISLRNLGLTVHLGHPDGSSCAQPQRTVGNFVVIHTNGVHEVKAAFCGCTHAFVAPHKQLVRERWWPATVDLPKTAATFEALDLLDSLSAAGKTNAYEFWNAMCALTDSTGTHKLPDRTKELARMAHEWRHILMCKRAGRGHDRFGGIEDTAPGDLAVLCPSCPHEGLNTDILEKVAAVGPELAAALKHFGRVFAAMDCNFRAKNKDNRSNWETSPALGDGMAFMAPRQEYEDFTNSSSHQDELSSCSRFGAMVLANLKMGKGMRTTGIGAVFCSRHGLFWPNTVGTLVKGERFCTMDFILAAFARRIRASSVHLSYDIICQYSRNLEKRMSEVKTEFEFMHVGAAKLLHELDITLAVPKFHNPGHKPLCQQWYNLAFQLFTGQTDGEASERAWAGLNRAAASFKEMGPGTMRDTIDFYCNTWNWKKFITIGLFLVRKLERAMEEAEDHSMIYTGLRSALAAESAETVEEWTEEVVVFETRDEGEEGDIVKNPYKPLAKPMTLAKAREESAGLMAAAIDRLGESSGDGGRKAVPAAGETASPAVTNFVLRAFKIELLKLRATARTKYNTALQRAEQREHANEIARLLVQHRKDQQWIQPSVYAGLQELGGEDEKEEEVVEEDDEDDEDDEEEDEPSAGKEDESRAPELDAALPLGNKAARGLYLPSELSRELALEHPRELLYEEMRLRWGGMGDNVIMVRQYARIKGTVNAFKRKTLRGQNQVTRARHKQNAIEANLDTVKESYRVHRARFARLVSLLDEDEREARVPKNWEARFQVLEDSDCIALGHRLLMRIEDEQIKRVRRIVQEIQTSGESSHKVPWIWYTIVEGGHFELNDDMRVEFIKCRARAMRWNEEVYALCIEMIRAPTFIENKAVWWEKKSKLDMGSMGRDERDGARAYAKKQAAMYRRQAESLTKRFAKPLRRAAVFMQTHGLDGLLLTEEE